MKRVVALGMILILTFSVMVNACAEDLFVVLRMVFDDYYESIEKNGVSDTEADYFSSIYMLQTTDGVKMFQVGVLPAEEEVMRSWYMQYLAPNATDFAFETYEQDFKTTLQIFQHAKLYPWNVKKSVSFTSTSYFTNHSNADMAFIGLKDKETEALLNDELYILARFRVEDPTHPNVNQTSIVAITDQEMVLECVSMLYDNEKTRSCLSNEIIEWFSRRPESGFLAPVVIEE